MSSGRKKSNIKPPEVDAPPRITTYDFHSPTGDRYVTSVDGDKQITRSYLSPLTQQMVNRSQQGLVDISEGLVRTDAQRAADIRQRSQDFYDLQARNINEEADEILAKGQSQIAHRFGGAYNATFGTDYLARLEKDRLSQLHTAGKEASLLAEDLYARDESSRLQRLGFFQNYLAGLHDQSWGPASLGSGLLQTETNRAHDLAILRTNMAQQAMNTNLLAEQQQERQNQRKRSIAQALVMSAGMAATPYTGGASMYLASAGSTGIDMMGR